MLRSRFSNLVDGVGFHADQFPNLSINVLKTMPMLVFTSKSNRESPNRHVSGNYLL